MMWMLVNRKEDIFEINVRENRRGNKNRNRKDRLTRNQNNMSEWKNMFTHGLTVASVS
jgi:hypothetical protein